MISPETTNKRDGADTNHDSTVATDNRKLTKTSKRSKLTEVPLQLFQ
eukprot:COSAG05_NODE_2306_length_3249_cov_2.568889_7_plen_47_part_00